MARAFVFVLDSLGIGGAPDAADYGDAGSDTFGHIDAACANGAADRAGLRAGPLSIPHLDALGYRAAHALANGLGATGARPTGFHGAATETSRGKDTPSGHWEMAGVPVDFDWGYFPDTRPAFPAELTAALIREAGLPGILADCHASGTQVIADYGAEHIRSGKPICYTSVDSVLQIAAHETHFGLERLYETCRIARRLVDPYRIGRVIARPFVGETPDSFARTANRKDLATPPPRPTLLDRLVAEGRRVIAIGKIGDIFAHRGISEVRKGAGNMAMFDAALTGLADAGDGDLVFANFVDFDTEYGHRRDVAGYAAAIEAFDRRMPEALALLRPGDMLILTGDHGNDPTWRGTDHTRERVPVCGTGPGFAATDLGVLPTFADIGQTVADHLGIAPLSSGTSFLHLIRPRA